MNRILIDFRYINAKTGFSTYLKMILKVIAQDVAFQNNYYLLVNDNYVDFNFEDYINTNKIKFVIAKSKPFSFMSNIEIPILMWKNDIKIFHAINVDIPLGIVFLPHYKLISTIHDIIPLKYAHLYNLSLVKRIYFEIMNRLCSNLSHQILTVSNYTKNDLMTYLKINENKITVIYNSFESKIKKSKQIKRNKIRLLFVGTNFKYKNILEVIKAVKILQEKNIDVLFDIAGAERDYTNELRTYIQKNNLENNVIIHGKVSEEKLAELYQNASILTFPSLVEGFGVPLLEAMDYRLPVISSNRTVMPEVVEDAGILIEPTAENFAESIEYLIKNPDIAKQLVNKGYKRLKFFSQEKFNAEMKKVYSDEKE